MEISTILILVQTIAGVIIALVALFAINTWRKEIRGKKEFDVAYELLSSIYHFRDAISQIRDPFYAVNEGETRKRFDWESAKDNEIYDRASVVLKRYRLNSALFNNISTLRYRLEASFEAADLSIFEDVKLVQNEILNSARAISKLWSDALVLLYLGGITDTMTKEEIDNKLAVIWEGYGAKEDTIRKEVEEIVRKTEQICRPKIRWK